MLKKKLKLFDRITANLSVAIIMIWLEKYGTLFEAFSPYRNCQRYYLIGTNFRAEARKCAKFNTEIMRSVKVREN